MLPVGPILLAIMIALTASGFFDGVLGLLKLSPRVALMLLVAMLLGGAIEVPLGQELSINLGSGILPLVIALRLLWTADEWFEPVRAVGAALLTGVAVFILWTWFPPHQPTELNLFGFDAHYLAGLVGGSTGYTFGKSSRAAFCAGLLGVLLGDAAHYAISMRMTGPFQLGGGGFQGTPIIAGLLALALASLAAEAFA